MALRKTSIDFDGVVICSMDLVMLSYDFKLENIGNTPSLSRGCPNGRTSSGVESLKAVATPGYAFSAPGPVSYTHLPLPTILRV